MIKELPYRRDEEELSTEEFVIALLESEYQATQKAHKKLLVEHEDIPELLEKIKIITQTRLDLLTQLHKQILDHTNSKIQKINLQEGGRA